MKKKKSGAKKTKDTTADAPGAETSIDVADAPEAEETPAEEAVEEKPEDAESSSPSATPSLAQQSKLRSTSFRTGAGTTSPGPFSPDGDTAPDIYRKHVARIEELEKDNKRLAKEGTDAEKRWKKAEEELADLREVEGDAPKDGDDSTEKLVSPIGASEGCV